MRCFPVLALSGFLWTASVQASQDQSASLLQRGQPLPGLVLPTIDGQETVDLAGLRGKKVLLIQFASW
jgi:hypothetical protein